MIAARAGLSSTTAIFMVWAGGGVWDITVRYQYRPPA
jgi:hypothetical protein